MSEPQVIDVSIKEMLEAMSRYKDEDTFRYYQISWVGQDGMTVAGNTLRVTVGQARKELGL